MDWALLVGSIALVAVTGGLVYFTRGLVDEARKTRGEMEKTRGEMEQTRGEMEEARRLGVRPHLTLEPVWLGPTYATLELRNLGPGAARNVTLQFQYEPVGDVREFATPVILPGQAEQVLLPKSVNDLNAARAPGVTTRVTGDMEDVYGDRLPVELVFEWAPWVDELTQEHHRTHEEPVRPIVKALEAIENELARIVKGD